MRQAIDIKGFGRRLQKARQSSGYKRQDQFGEALLQPKDKNTISSWENGKTFPTLDELQQLTDTLNCDIEYLFGWQGDELRHEGHTPEYWLGFLEGILRHERVPIGGRIEQIYWDSLGRYNSQVLRAIDDNWQDIEKFIRDLQSSNSAETLIHTIALVMHYLTNRLKYPERLEYAELAKNCAQELENQFYADVEVRRMWKQTKLLFAVDGIGWACMEIGDFNRAFEILEACLKEAKRHSFTRLCTLTQIFLARATWHVKHTDSILSSIETGMLRYDYILQTRYYMVKAEIASSNKDYHSAVKLLRKARQSQKLSGEGHSGTMVTLGLAYLGQAAIEKDKGFWIEEARKCLGYVNKHAPPIDYRWAEYAWLVLDELSGENHDQLHQNALILLTKLRVGGHDDELDADLAPLHRHNILRELERFLGNIH